MDATTAWHGNHALKAEVLARMLVHRQEDSIVQGFYQELDPELASGYRGCLIGCTLPKLTGPDGRISGQHWHQRVETLYGIPKSIGVILDHMFEDLPPSECANFAVESIEAIPVNADLSRVLARWALDLLTDETFGLAREVTEPGIQDKLAAVVELHERLVTGRSVLPHERHELAEGIYESMRNLAGGVQRQIGYTLEYTAYGEYSELAAGLASVRAMNNDSSDYQQVEWSKWAAEQLLHRLATAPVQVPVS